MAGLAKDYDIQCEDVSHLVKVSEFKKRCRELYDDVVGAHVSGDSDHVTYPPDIAEMCSTESLLPADGLDHFMKGKRDALKNTKLQCLNHADAQREYFDRKGLAFHGYGEISDSAKPPGGVASAGPSAPPTAVHGEVLLSVFIYHPIKKRRDTKILVLGCQQLTVLRDMIPCFRDFIVDRDYSEDPSEFDHRSLMTGTPPNRSASAFFFINNTFYNDRRHPNSGNLSLPVIEWSQKTDIDKSSRLDYYQIADMAGTKFDQLSLRLGYPYLFCHHTTCQHIIIFTDLRLLHPTESRLISKYPKKFPLHAGKRKLCHVCGLFSPRWVTLEDQLASESPCLFCGDCFKKLHYSEDGRKVCKFRAYPYNPTVLF